MPAQMPARFGPVNGFVNRPIKQRKDIALAKARGTRQSGSDNQGIRL
jgi:hypothetical protein